MAVAKDFAAAADFKVAHGEVEAAAKDAVLFDGVKATGGGAGEVAVFGEEEVGVGLTVATADATA